MRRFISSIPLLLIMVVLAGCAALLEGDTESERLHVYAPKVEPPEEQVEVSDYEELLDEMLERIMQHADSVRMYSSSYDGDIDADIQQARDEIMN